MVEQWIIDAVNELQGAFAAGDIGRVPWLESEQYEIALIIERHSKKQLAAMRAVVDAARRFDKAVRPGEQADAIIAIRDTLVKYDKAHANRNGEGGDDE